MNGSEEKQFWIQLGINIGETKACAQGTEKKLDKFISNDFAHLDTKVDENKEVVLDRLSKVEKKLAVIMGVVGFVWILVQILLKVFPILKNWL